MGNEMCNLLQVLGKISTIFGPIFGMIFIIILLLLAFILHYFKSRLSSISDEISNKAVAAFNKKIELYFRDEDIRRTLRIDIGKRSLDKKLTVFEEMFQLYYDYQDSWSLNEKTRNDNYQKLNTKLISMRKKLFLYTHYLGGYLTDCFLQMINLMDNNIRIRLQPYFINPERDIQMNIDEQDIYKYLAKSQKWIQDNLYSDQNIINYEFTKEQEEHITQERNKFLQSPKNK